MTSLDSPKIVIVLILLLGVGYGGWVFLENSQSQNPHWQIDKTNSRGFPPHRLNIWSEPNPPIPGTVTISVGLDFVNLMNDRIDAVRFSLIDPGQPGSPLDRTRAEFRETGPYRSRYTAPVKIPEPGRWILQIHADWKNYKSTSELELTVRP